MKRLQTFPDDFELAGSIENQWRQVGNAVPPLLAECLARKAVEALEGVTKVRVGSECQQLALI